jgi:rod shape determining protein RodA
MRLRFTHVLLVSSVVLLSFFGLVTVFNLGGDNSLFYKQLLILGISMSAFLVVSKIDFTFLKRGHATLFFYIFVLLVLFVLLLFGYATNGAQSWFRVGGLSVQPAEIAKLSIILLLAKYFHRRHVEIQHFSHIFVSFVYTSIIGLFVLLQPDLGSSLVVFGIWAIMLFISGISKKHIAVLAVCTGLSVIFSWSFLFKEYQKERILNFLDPVRDVRGSGYNVYQSMIAVGSGGVFGKGVDFGTQSNLEYLPEYETDFIFAAFSEEWGFVGSFFVIILFLIIMTSLLYLAITAPGNFELLYTVGVSAYLPLRLDEHCSGM